MIKSKDLPHERSEQMASWTYIMASRGRTLYAGVTNDLERRALEHASGRGSGFTAKYNVHHLVYAEEFGDVHAGSEVHKDGRLVCPRRGQAVDLRVANTSAAEIAAFIQAELPFDLLYLYGDDRPLHVSIGPQSTRMVVQMRQLPDGRLVPQVRRWRFGEEIR